MLLAHPKYLWLLLVLVPLIAWYIWKQRRLHASLSVSTTAPFASMPGSWKAKLRHAVFALQMIAIASLIVVLARPQKEASWRTSSTEGTDIVVALDISSSMLARDFEPDRFEAAREVAQRFVLGREHDNLGFVIFAGESFTGVPMTTDRTMLANYIGSIEMGMLQDNTAIGDGIATSINRIKDGKAKSKSIILLTDGSNNAGIVDPLTAAEIAAKLGIKIYTIGIGKKGEAPYPQYNAYGMIEYVNMPVTIDEEKLQRIADITGGKYFRATDEKVLSQVFDEIDQLEKTEIDVRVFSNTEDDYMLWGLIALGALALAMVIRYTILRHLP